MGEIIKETDYAGGIMAAANYAGAAGNAAKQKNWLGGIGGGAASGAAIGSMFAPGIGTGIGAGIGAMAGGIMTALSPEEEEEDLSGVKESIRLQNKLYKQQIADKQRKMDWMTNLSNRFKYK